VRLLRKDGSEEVHRYAFNVEAEEGDLRISSGSHLAAKLQGVSYRYWAASAFQEAKDESAGYNLSQFFLVLMIMLLLGEQLLAWSASYHPPAAQRGAAGGGLR